MNKAASQEEGFFLKLSETLYFNMTFNKMPNFAYEVTRSGENVMKFEVNGTFSYKDEFSYLGI